jgi:hypothetical protein
MSLPLLPPCAGTTLSACSKLLVASTPIAMLLTSAAAASAAAAAAAGDRRYHPECLKTSRKALKSQTNWRCPDCVKRLGVAPPAGTAAAPAHIAATARSRDDEAEAAAAQKAPQQKRRKTGAE